MKKNLSTILIISFIIIGSYGGILNFISDNAQAPPTYVSGIQYDGFGGPWTLAESPYIIVGNVTIPIGQVLTIQAGVQVKFDGYFCLYVNGTLNAQGTGINRINVTSNKTIPAMGDWNTIQVNSSGQINLRFSNIYYAEISIYLNSSSNNVIANNTISTNLYGFSLNYSSNNSIAYNTISSNNEHGILLDSSSKNNITNNTISFNNRDGVSIHYSSNNNIIANNNISNNGKGITIHSSSRNNKITNNNISNNSDGIYLSATKNNITHNNIINNVDGIEVHSSSNNIIDNNISSNNGFGIRLDYVSNNVLIGNIVSNNGYGIFLGTASNTNISYNNISSNHWYGIYLHWSSNDYLIGNNFSNDGIFISGYWDYHYNSHIIPNNNKVNGKPLYYYKDCSGLNIDGVPIGQLILANCTNVDVTNLEINNTDVGIEVAYSTNINLTDNNVSSNYGYGIYLDWSIDNNVSNNNIFSNRNEGIFLGYSYYNTLANNSVSDNSYGIALSTSSYNDIIRNNVSSNKDSGIIIYSPFAFSSLNKITDNNISLNNGSGIILGTPTGFLDTMSIINNNISNNNGSGIIVGFSSDIYILNNIISDNQENGILISQSSPVHITDNVISWNGEKGIYISSSNVNKIVTNHILNNTYGLYFQSALGNRIYHNTILNNTNQAYDDMGTNFWNDTYPSSGNFWSDYSPICIDIFEGAITPQTTGLSDNICDTPYNITIGTADYYPLTQQFAVVAPPTNLSVELTGNNLENVTISWNASQDDFIRVKKYAVYYSTSYDMNGLNYEFLADISAIGASKYYLNINGIGEGDSFNYFFYVQANATYSNSKNDTQVAKFTRSFSPGKHLISIPLILNYTRISDVLQTLKFNVAWFYDNADVLDPWKSYNPSRPFNDLKAVNRTMALWINVTENSNLTIAGIVPKTTSIELKQGWNFVGYPSLIKRIVVDALSGVSYEMIEGYSSLLPENLRTYSGSDFMVSGYGYWIKISTDVIWTLNN